MKYIVLMSLLGFSKMAFATCTDFSGKYQTTDSNDQVINLTVVQTQCQQLDFTYDYGQGVVFTKTLIVDGQRRPVVDIPTYTQSEADSWDGAKIAWDGIVHNVQYKEDSTYKGATYFDEKKNLVEEVNNFDSKGSPTWSAKSIYTRTP